MKKTWITVFFSVSPLFINPWREKNTDHLHQNKSVEWVSDLPIQTLHFGWPSVGPVSHPAALTWKIPPRQAISSIVAPIQTPVSVCTCARAHADSGGWPSLPRRLHSDWMSDAADSCTHHSVLWIHYLLCSSKHWFISLRPKSKRTHVPALAKKKWKENQQIN